MNIQNISALEKQLEMLGFENLGYSLLKKICFKPDNFFLSHKIGKGKDRLCFQLHFEKDKKKDCYVLVFHDAVLQKGILLPDTTMNGINIQSLEKEMMAIDWQGAFDYDEKKRWDVDDKSSWEMEANIEKIVESLLALESTEEGKVIASNIKFLFWGNVFSHELAGNLSSFKNKSEVGQRFYFFEDQASISVEEAYRFLQNKWIEKQVQAKRKQAGELSVVENGGSDLPEENMGLLKKKSKNKRN